VQLGEDSAYSWGVSQKVQYHWEQFRKVCRQLYVKASRICAINNILDRA